MFAYCNNNPVRYVDHSGNMLIEITLSTAGMVVAVSICGLAIIHLGAMALCSFLDWLADQWFYLHAQVSFIYEPDPEPRTEYAEVTASYVAPDPFDDDDDFDDDYYDDDSNFGGRQKIGKPKGSAPGNNRSQNKQFRDATKKLLNKDQQRALHDDITGKGYGYHDIVEATKIIWAFIFALFDEDNQ